MSENLISKEKAYEVLTEYYHHKTEWQHKALREALDRVPPVDIDLSDYSDRLWRKAYEQGKADAEPRKKGKWINCGSSEHWKCSCCGIRALYWFNEENSSGWYKDMSEWLSDYCPNCGADMRGEDK